MSMSPRTEARIAGLFYLITFVGGIAALFSIRGRVAAGLIAGAAYVAVTLLFYDIFKPVNKIVSLVAAVFSIAGIVIGPLSQFHIIPFQINSLVFFGIYCLLIAWLIVKSTFLPKFLGVLMAIGGLGWLTFASASLSAYLAPYNLAPGVLGEGVLTLWLLIVGLNAARWNESVRVAA